MEIKYFLYEQFLLNKQKFRKKLRVKYQSSFHLVLAGGFAWLLVVVGVNCGSSCFRSDVQLVVKVCQLSNVDVDHDGG